MLTRALCLAWLLQAAAGDVTLQSKDGQSELALPEGWAPIPPQTGLSQLMAANPARHEFVDLVTEDRRDLALTLKDYAAHRRADRPRLAAAPRGRMPA